MTPAELSSVGAHQTDLNVTTFGLIFVRKI